MIGRNRLTSRFQYSDNFRCCSAIAKYTDRNTFIEYICYRFISLSIFGQFKYSLFFHTSMI